LGPFFANLVIAGNWPGRISIQVDEYHAMSIDNQIHLPESIFFRFEALLILKFWGFDQSSLAVILPAMVSTGESVGSLHLKSIRVASIPVGCAARFAHYRIRTMATDIHKSSDLIIDATNDEKRETSELKGMIIPTFFEPSGVAYIQPGLRKERSSLEIKSCCVWSWEMSRWWLFSRTWHDEVVWLEVAQEVASGFAKQGNHTADNQGRYNGVHGY
jgi:hypothetical protein